MRTLIFVLSFFCCTTASAQWVWTGGTPGKATDWMEPHNWNMKQVPTAEASVRIPKLNTSFYPNISATVPAISHLEVEDGAYLYLAKTGYLRVDGQHTDNVGVLLTGKIMVCGLMAVYNTAQEEIVGNQSHLITYPEDGLISFKP